MNRHRRQVAFASMLAIGLAVQLPARAQDAGVVTIEGTRIRGDQEVPTVMFLVPWQPPEVEALPATDERLMVEQAFEPIERYEFQRLVRYHRAFAAQQAEQASGEQQP